jgi:hypothetical protein
VWNLVAHIEGGTQAEGIENRVLRRVFGPKRDEVAGERRKLHNKELNDLCHTKYYAGDQIENEMGGACSMYGGKERRIQGFGGET